MHALASITLAFVPGDKNVPRVSTDDFKQIDWQHGPASNENH